MNETDEKVKEYLERASSLIERIDGTPYWILNKDRIFVQVEIAKMIQLEEHWEEKK